MTGDSNLLKNVWKIASEHFLESQNGSTGSIKNPNEILKNYDLNLKKDPSTEEDLMEDMRSYLSLTTNTLTPNFQNQLFAGLNPYALAGDWLTSLTNTTMATFEVAPFSTLIEKKIIEHMISKIGWTDGDGIMATGGSNANMIAMLLARNTRYPEIKRTGQTNKKLTVFVSEDAHYSFEKAANILGIGLEQVRKIKTNGNGEMDVAHLEEMILQSKSHGEAPFFVAATSGTTVRGSFDPIHRISTITKRYDLWLHVDGAWGGSVLLSSKHRHLLQGIEGADSMTWDTHKMMGTGLMSSFFLTKCKNSLRYSHNDGGGDYIFHESEVANWDTGPSSLQCGRRNDSLKVWIAWRSLGDSGFEKQIDHLFQIAEKARVLIEKTDNLELVYPPNSLNLCFSFTTDQNGDEINKEIRARLLSEGDFYINIATKSGKTFFRLIIVHPKLTENHLVDLFASIKRLGHQIISEQNLNSSTEAFIQVR